MPYGIIYVAENLVNGKCYVGQTTRSFEIRKKQHLNRPEEYSAFEQAILKYGNDNFRWEIIDEADNQEVLDMLERLHISRYESSVKEWGYNIREGGSNGKHSLETRKKMSEAQKGEKNPNYGKRGKDAPCYGKHHSEETKRKLSKANKGRKHPPEICKKISQNNGSRRPEVRKKIGEAGKGRKHSLESKSKMSKGKLGKYKGASFSKHHNPERRCWFSGIRYNFKRKSLGYYEDPFTASLVYQLVWNEIYA